MLGNIANARADGGRGADVTCRDPGQSAGRAVAGAGAQWSASGRYGWTDQRWRHLSMRGGQAAGRTDLADGDAGIRATRVDLRPSRGRPPTANARTVHGPRTRGAASPRRRHGELAQPKAGALPAHAETARAELSEPGRMGNRKVRENRERLRAAKWQGFGTGTVPKGVRMPQILVNGRDLSLDPPCVYWGQALEQLDRRAAGDGRVLTGVRFDGVDQPSFRDASYVDVALDEFAVVEADATSPAALLDESIDEAVAAAKDLAAAAERLGTTFRGFDVSYANQDLVELAQGLSTLVNLVRALAMAVGVPIEEVKGPQGTANAMVEQLSGHMATLIDAQQSEDWITVADVIEYDIAPALQGWPGVFEALRAAVSR
jgi:hypothetical protein